SLAGSVFFFQAEDGIRDFHVTGVQTCALPIWLFRFFVQFMDQFCHQTGPSSLMRRPKASSIVTMKVLIKKYIILKMRIRLHFLVLTINRSSSILVTHE